MSAACKFSRMYGNDPKVNFDSEAIERLSKLFGKKVPPRMFTPCEIQEFCKARRGRPADAVKDHPKFVQERISDGHEFEYDIKRQRTPYDSAPMMNEDSVEADDAAFAILELSLQKQPGNEKPLSSHETHHLSENGRQPLSGPLTPSSTETCEESTLRRQARGKLRLHDFAGLSLDPDLAYGTYYPAQGRIQDQPFEMLKRGVLELLGISRSENHRRGNANGRTEQRAGVTGIEMIDVQPSSPPNRQDRHIPRPGHLHMPNRQSFN